MIIDVIHTIITHHHLYHHHLIDDHGISQFFSHDFGYSDAEISSYEAVEHVSINVMLNIRLIMIMLR